MDNAIVRKAIATLESEFDAQGVSVRILEQEVTNLECQLEEKDVEIGALLVDIAELQLYIKDLENSLAEAHLTSVDTQTSDTI